MNAETPQNSKVAMYRDPFAPGNDPRRNRKGRTGSRAKLAKRFFEDTYAAWEEQGDAALSRAAFHDPMGFVNMVARLMPQKVEVSTPTDGMTDERLAQMLELAERMAALKAGTPATVAPLLSDHEYREAAEAAKAGGGGPNRLEPHRTENTAYALRPPPADEPVAEHNKLDLDSTPATIAGMPRADMETIQERVRALPPLNPDERLPYPVGRATPLSAVEAERRNVAKLHDDSGIDPASLF